MTASRIAILDPAAGISGDMLLGALLEVGAPAEWLTTLPHRLGYPDVAIDVGRVLRCGISAAKVTVRLPGGRTEPPSPAYVAAHAHGAESHHDHGHGPHQHHHGDHAGHGPDDGHGAHHHLADLIRVIVHAQLSDRVKQTAIRAFELLCQAEGRIHGVAPEAVALHEVGAVDAIIDIVGVIEGFERLGIERIYSRPVALGSGWVRAAHGVISVPAPVTARLLEGIDIGPNGPVIGEATTPTGAVLLRVLSAGPPPSRWRACASGWGAGERDPEHYPNALRLLLAEVAAEAGEVDTFACDLDDLSPEYIDPLREALVAAGALDVQLWTTQMKKGRPGFRIEVLADPADSARVLEALFRHSTTAGVRRTRSERVTLARREIVVPGPEGRPIRVKVLATPGGPRVKAEFEDVRAAAERVARPAHEVAREVEAAARQLVASGAIGDSRTPKEQG